MVTVNSVAAATSVVTVNSVATATSVVTVTSVVTATSVVTVRCIVTHFMGRHGSTGGECTHSQTNAVGQQLGAYAWSKAELSCKKFWLDPCMHGYWTSPIRIPAKYFIIINYHGLAT